MGGAGVAVCASGMRERGVLNAFLWKIPVQPMVISITHILRSGRWRSGLRPYFVFRL
jgi:hypothetical protein